MAMKTNLWSNNKAKKIKPGAPFHERYRNLIIVGCLGGIYHPSLNKVFLSRIGQWIARAYTFICYIFLFIFPILNVIHLLFIATKLYQVTMDLMIICSGMHGGFRIAPTIIWRKDFGNLYDLWDEYFGSDNDIVERQKYIDKHYNKVKKRLYQLTPMALLALNPWMIAQYFAEDKILKVPTPLPYRPQSPDYEFLVTFYVYPCAVHSAAASAIHLYMLLPVVWILAELERLKFALRSILSLGGDLDTPSPEKIEDIRQRLGVWIKQHQKLILFYRKTQKMVWIAFSIEMLATFMAAWLTAFNYVQAIRGHSRDFQFSILDQVWTILVILEQSGLNFYPGILVIAIGKDIVIEDKVTQVFFYMPYVLMFALTCSYCDKAKEESQFLIDEAYTTDWIAMPKEVRSSLVIIAQQTQIPFIIKGFGIFPTGYFTFAQIMQSAYSVLNFLLAAQE